MVIVLNLFVKHIVEEIDKFITFHTNCNPIVEEAVSEVIIGTESFNIGKHSLDVPSGPVVATV